jgi:hypothetical protein
VQLALRSGHEARTRTQRYLGVALGAERARLEQRLAVEHAAEVHVAALAGEISAEQAFNTHALSVRHEPSKHPGHFIANRQQMYARASTLSSALQTPSMREKKASLYMGSVSGPTRVLRATMLSCGFITLTAAAAASDLSFYVRYKHARVGEIGKSESNKDGQKRTDAHASRSPYEQKHMSPLTHPDAGGPEEELTVEVAALDGVHVRHVELSGG